MLDENSAQPSAAMTAAKAIDAKAIDAELALILLVARAVEQITRIGNRSTFNGPIKAAIAAFEAG